MYSHAALTGKFLPNLGWLVKDEGNGVLYVDVRCLAGCIEGVGNLPFEAGWPDLK